MASMLEGALASTIYKAANFIFMNATLTRQEGTVSSIYSCRAIEDRFGFAVREAGLVNRDDIKVLILAKSLAVEPRVNDRITIRGRTVAIVADEGGVPPVESDPARATWVCRCSS